MRKGALQTKGLLNGMLYEVFFVIVNEIFEWKIYSHIGHHYSKIIFLFYIE